MIKGGLLETTEFHSQLVYRDSLWSFMPMKDVKVVDSLYHIDGYTVEIESVEVLFEKKRIFPMTLGGTHTYFANNILTHNVKTIQQ